MDKETKDMLRQIIANQAVIFQRLEDMYQKQIKGTTKAFYDEERALKDLSDGAKKVLDKIR